MPSTLASDRKASIGVALVLISAVGFAVGPTAAKLAFDNGSNTLTLVTLRGLIGALLLGLLIVVRRQGFRISRHAFRWVVLCSVFSAFMVYGFLGSVAYIPIGVAVLIFFVHPILLALIVHWRGGDRLTIRKLLFACGALAGLGLALAPTFDNIAPIGVGLAALGAVSVCGMILCGAHAQQDATSTQVNCYVSGLTGIAFALLTTALGAWSLPYNLVGWLGVIGAGCGVAVALLAFFAAFRYLSPVRATMLTNVEPLLSILLAALLIGERLEPLQWIGAFIMVGSIVLFEAADRATTSALETHPN